MQVANHQVQTTAMFARQLASYEWHHRLLCITFKLGRQWHAEWELVPLPQSEGRLYQLRFAAWGLMGSGSFGHVY